MKKALARGAVVLALLTGLAVGPAAASEIRFGFSLSGGLGNINGGDFNRMIRDQNAFVADYNDEYEDQYSIDWKEMKWLPKFGGEFNLRFGPNFGIGLGVEYIKKTNPGMINQAYEESFTDYGLGYYEKFSQSYDSTTEISQALTVIPITLSLYGFLPLGPRAEAYVRAGAGYYLGRLAADESGAAEMVYNDNYYWNDGTPWPPHYHVKLEGSDAQSWEATCNTVGFHFGAGFNFNVSSNIALFGEAFYRLVNFKDWQGSLTQDAEIRFYEGWTNSTTPDNLTLIDSLSYDDSFDGQLWYLEDVWTDLATGAYGMYGMYESGDEPEENTWTENVRPAEINLNGFTFRVGIRIFFGGLR